MPDPFHSKLVNIPNCKKTIWVYAIILLADALPIASTALHVITVYTLHLSTIAVILSALVFHVLTFIIEIKRP